MSRLPKPRTQAEEKIIADAMLKACTLVPFGVDPTEYNTMVNKLTREALQELRKNA